MNNETVLEELEPVLDELVDSLNGLVERLREEREAIVDFDLKRIEKAHRAKYEKLLQVEALEASRKEFVRKLSDLNGIKGFPKLDFILDQLPFSHKIERIKERMSCIRSIAQAANEFNEIQREYLSYSLASIQSSLMLLDTLQGNGNFPSYNERGNLQTEAISAKRTILQTEV